MLSQAANLLNFALIKKRETVYHIVYHIVYQKRENCVSKNEGMFFLLTMMNSAVLSQAAQPFIRNRWEHRDSKITVFSFLIHNVIHSKILAPGGGAFQYTDLH